MLTSLQLHHFRSYSDLTLDFSDRVLVILGPNATGKTNILEALYTAATGRSFRADDEDLVEFQAPGYRIDVRHDNESMSVVYARPPAKRKKFMRNEVAISRQKLLGLHPAVLFEPGDLMLFAGSPEGRRRYLDLLLYQTHDTYRRAHTLYRRILRQRNNLLWRAKHHGLQGINDQLFVLNAQLTEPAEQILAIRQVFLTWLLPEINQHMSQIAQSASNLELIYTEKTSGFMQRLEAAQARDEMMGTTSVGPHREDWGLKRNGVAFEDTASRGEMRTLLLGLKLAEVSYIQAETDTIPLLLLDDVFSELDESRRHFLIHELKEVQTVITTTDIDRRLDLPAQTLDLTPRKTS